MSTKINDLANDVLIKNASGSPAAQTSTVTGATLDMITGDGPCFAIQDVGTVSGTLPTLDGKIQEGSKSDGSDMADIAGATFTRVIASTNLQTINFLRTKRYVRYVGTIAASANPSFALDVLILEQLKLLG